MLTSKLQQLTTKKSTEWRNKRDMLLSVVSLNSSPLNIFERKNNKKNAICISSKLVTDKSIQGENPDVFILHSVCF